MPFQKEPIQNYIGKGIIFPIELIKGRAVLETGFPLIRSSIAIILKWPIGTRYFNGAFGSELDELLEEPNDSALKVIVENYVVDAITTWEKRIELLDSEIVYPDKASLSISLTYQVRNSKAQDTFVFPFYTKIIY